MTNTSETWTHAAGQRIPLTVRPFINGDFVDSDGTEVWTKFSPSDGQPLMQFSSGSPKDVDKAMASGRVAFEDGRWSDISTDRRAAVLLKLADLIDRQAKELALTETLEVGKPIRDAENVDLVLASAVLRYNAANADKAAGIVLPVESRSLCQTTRGPRGVVGAIVGWNFPLLLAVIKAGPALATGNSLVLKPSELSSLTALRLAQLALEAGVPDGVFNVVTGTGRGVGDALARHADLDMLTFTGSSETGRQLLVAVGQSAMKPLLLECGGKSPNIVFDDCPNLDGVADAVTARMYWNQGQVCTAGSRLLVQASVKDELLDKIRQRAHLLVPGNPFAADTGCGPLISAPQMNKVMNYIRSGIEQGGRLLIGGRRTLEETGGYFVETTIFDQVSPEMRIFQEEIFGPVLAVTSFTDAEDACRLANATSYGLSATVWTRSVNRIHLMMKKLRVGEIDVKATAQPSTGPLLATLPLEPHKQSGIGIEGGIEGLKSYTVLRSVKIFTE